MVAPIKAMKVNREVTRPDPTVYAMSRFTNDTVLFEHERLFHSRQTITSATNVSVNRATEAIMSCI